MDNKLEIPQALFKSASTRADGGWKIVFELQEGPEIAVILAALATLRGKVLKLGINEEA